MNWSMRRKIIYGAGGIVLALGFVIYHSRDLLFPTPTCFDKSQNGYESGVDCGGTCALRCTDEVAQLAVEWSQVIPTSSTTYDLVAMVANRNTDSAPHAVSYTFIPLDKDGNVITTITGVSPVIVDGDFPIIQTNVALPRPPTSVATRLTPEPLYVVAERPQAPVVRVTDWRYEAGVIPRIYVTVKNTSRTIFMKLPIRVVAYDSRSNAIAVGESIIPNLGKEEGQNVVFTWHNQFPQAPTQIRVYPVLDPFIIVQ